MPRELKRLVISILADLNVTVYMAYIVPLIFNSLRPLETVPSVPIITGIFISLA